MSKKRKHGGVKQGFDLFERAQRELAKGNVKDALRDAKICYREAPDPERHMFLERAYSARAEQLQKAGLQDQAQNTFGELVELGVTAPDVQAKLPRLRILLGLTNPTPAGGAANIWDENPELLIELADQAVFHPQQVPGQYVEIHRDCQRIRAALEAVERGEDAAAADQLNDISRRSPYADWKLFVRGLSAFYANDAERARANWDRLEPKRSAFRMAQTLLVHSSQLTADKAALNVANGLRRLEYAVESDPVREQLKTMSEHQRAGNSSGLFHTFRSFCQRFGKSYAPLIERITDMLWKRVIREQRVDQLKRLTAIAPAPRLDPHWNRAHALWSEQASHSTYEATEKYWQAYVKDILQEGFLQPDERGIAAGLIYQRMAKMAVAAAHDEESHRPFARVLGTAGYAAQFRQEAVGFYQQSIRHAPQLRGAYGELAKLHLESDEPSWAVKTYQALLAHFPDDYETHVWLANYYLENDKPDTAERYSREAQRLKPRDPATVTLMWNQRLAMMRLCAKKRKFAMARQEWELLQQIAPPDTEAYWLDLLRAAVEYKASNVEEAERWVAAATSKLKDPTPVWMIMHAHAARYALKREIKNDFGNRFKTAIAGACCSETAGQLAKVLLPFVQQQIKYTGLATHQRLALDYLQRCQGLSWNGGDLRHVVNFLMAADSWRHRALRDQLLTVGCARFPQEPTFPFLAGRMAMEDGPFRTNFQKARDLFEQALKANATATHPLTAEAVKTAKKAISMLDQAAQMQGSMFFGGPLDDDEYDDEYDDDDEYEFDDEFEEDYEDFSGNGRASAGATLDEADIERIVPPFMKEMFKKAAASLGISLPELADLLLTGELAPADILGGLGPPPPQGASKGRRGKKQKASQR